MKPLYALFAIALMSTSTALAHPGHDDDATVTTTEIGLGNDDNTPRNEVHISIKDGMRVITSNGIADHKTGEFPNDHNPSSIRAQNYSFQMPADPKIAPQITPLLHMPFGVALNGVVFDPGTAEFWNGDRQGDWNYEALTGKLNLGNDDSNAHVQPNGAYHYHGLPTALIAKLQKKGKMTLIGWAADGFPIYANYGYAKPSDAKSELQKMRSSYRLKAGTRPAGTQGPGGAYDGTFTNDFEYVAGAGDLDECNGIFGVTPEYPKGIYHYFLTEQFPFVPRNFRGTPDSSFQRRGPGGGPNAGGPNGRGPNGPPRRQGGFGALPGGNFGPPGGGFGPPDDGAGPPDGGFGPPDDGGGPPDGGFGPPDDGFGPPPPPER